MYATPIYLADALIQIEDRKAMGGTDQISNSVLGLGLSSAPVAGEIEIIKSREVVGQAIRKLKLDVNTSVMSRVPYYASRFERSVGGQGFALAPPKFGLTDWAWGGESLNVDVFEVPYPFQEKGFVMEVLDQRNWRLFFGEQLVAKGALGDLVAFKLDQHEARIRVKNFLARPGTRFGIAKQSEASAYKAVLANLKVIETTRGSNVVRVSFEDSDRANAIEVVNQITGAYLKQNVTRRSEEAERSLTFLDQQLPRLKKDVEKSEDELNKYRLQTKSIDLDKETDGLLQRSVDIQKARVDIQMRRQLLLQRFMPRHPEIQALDTQLAELAGQEETLFGLIQRLPETQQTFLRLQRDMTVNTELYTALLNSAQQLRIAKAGTIANVRIVDFANADDVPVRPQRMVILGIAAIVGLFLGVGFALLARALKPTIQNASEIETQLGLSVYATIPESPRQEQLSKSKRLSAKGNQRQLLYEVDPADSAIEALRSLRMGLQFAMVNASNKNVLITGPTANIGKSFLAANFAMTLVASGKRVLLIETDMRRPGIEDYFGVSNKPGLSEYLSGKKSFAEIVQTGTTNNPSLICAGAKVPNPGELLLHGRFKELLDSQQENFDYILLDSPPLLPVSDAMIVARLVAAVFLVIRAEQNSMYQVTEALRRMENAGIALKGVIFNGVRTRGLGNHYYDYHTRYE